jgi:hypothetical protein
MKFSTTAIHAGVGVLDLMTLCSNVKHDQPINSNDSDLLRIEIINRRRSLQLEIINRRRLLQPATRSRSRCARNLLP